MEEKERMFRIHREYSELAAFEWRKDSAPEDLVHLIHETFDDETGHLLANSRPRNGLSPSDEAARANKL